MESNELIKEAFGALNSYKRHRALKEIKLNDRQYHELQMFKMIDKIELALRAIQKAVRNGDIELVEEDDDESESDS
jgi:hypothetical protein